MRLTIGREASAHGLSFIVHGGLWLVYWVWLISSCLLALCTHRFSTRRVTSSSIQSPTPSHPLMTTRSSHRVRTGERFIVVYCDV